MSETLSIKRGKSFKIKYDYQSSSGFWLSNDQLNELAENLKNQGSSGVGFLVGHHLDKGNKDWFSVEIVPLVGEINNYIDDILGKDIQIQTFKDVKGLIDSEIGILHKNDSPFESQEAQRFPPPDC